jgi:hypothetical protein
VPAQRVVQPTEWLTAPARALPGWRPLTHSYRRCGVAEQSGVSVTPISATPMVRRGYGRDDIVNGRAGRGGVGFIVDERFVGGGLDDTMNTVGRLLQGLTAEHFTWQNGPLRNGHVVHHCGIQILSHQSFIRPAC